MNTVVMRAELEFESILQEHEELLDQARGFGMRTAAYPRGLMPLREAQEVVANFSKNTAKLDTFLSSLYDTKLRAPDDDTKAALNEVYARGEKALRKFQDDHKKAKEALEKHEDLLVGENFQEMFQALRLAVLDLDLTDNADFKAKTQLYLDANPAYGVGVATVSRTQPKEDVYKVRATYKAETDEYIADMWSKKSNRWFPAAKKTGHTRIPAFVKAVVDKMKAVHDFEGESMFGSRRTVEDTSPEITKYRDEVNALKARERTIRGREEVERKIQEIADAIDRKLKQQLPTARTTIGEIYRDGENDNRFLIYNTITTGDTRVQLATNLSFTVDSTGVVAVDRLWGNYGLLGSASGKLSILTVGPDYKKFPDRAVPEYIDNTVFNLIGATATLDPKRYQALSRKIESVAKDLRRVVTLTLSPGRDYETQGAGSLTRKYVVTHPRTNDGKVWIEASQGNTEMSVLVRPLTGSSIRDVHFKVHPKDAADQIIQRLGIPATATLPAPASTPTAPASTPTAPVAPSGGSKDVTPNLRDVVREIRKIGYPGNVVQTEIDKVLTGAAPSTTLSVSKLFPVEDSMQSDVQAIQDFARKVQGQYKNGTAQVGNVTITQKVTLKYRANIGSNLVTRLLPDNTDLAGAVGQYFATRGAGNYYKDKLPAMVTSFIAAVEVTVSRQGGRTARTTRTAGATTFDNLVWNPNISNAFRGIRSEELEEHGHRDGYPGTIAAKSRYEVRATEPMTEAEARAFMDKDVDKNDKWSDRAFAVPVTRAKVLTTDKVTVTITARDEKEALRQAQMRIYATGRFPPNANVVVSDLVSKKVSETPRTKTFEVTGTRKAVLVGTTDGWLFYGWAPE